MLRVLTGLLFGAFAVMGAFGLSVSFAKAFEVAEGHIWLGFTIAALAFVMGCVGLFILITTKASITISKQFVVGKQSETIKPAKKAKRK